MTRKFTALLMLVGLFGFVSACVPGIFTRPDPAAMYYPTYTAIAQGLIDLASTATARAGGDLQTPTVAPSPTSIATATPILGNGTYITNRENGATRYDDYDARFTITLPADWLSVRLNSEEFYAALGNEAASDEQLMRAMTASQNYDPNLLRLVAYDIKQEHRETDFMTNVNITWDSTLTATVDEILTSMPASMEQSIPDVNIISATPVDVGESKIPAGSVSAGWSTKTNSGGVVDMYQEVVFFKVPQGTVFITLTTSNALREQVKPDFDSMLNTLELFGQ